MLSHNSIQLDPHSLKQSHGISHYHGNDLSAHRARGGYISFSQDTPLLQEPLTMGGESCGKMCHGPLSADMFTALQYKNEQRSLRESGFSQYVRLPPNDMRDVDFLYTSWETMRAKESRVRVKPDYMKRFPTLNPEMRFLVVEWLCDSACDLQFHRQTFYLAVSYVDRYLSECDNFDGADIQWLGAASLLLASKMEETIMNEIELYVAFDWEGEDFENGLSIETRKRQSVERLLEWEDRILTVLDWDLRVPTAYEWLMHYYQNAALIKPDHYMDPETIQSRIIKRRFEVSHFLKAAKRLDLFMSDYESLVYENSLLAAIVFTEVALKIFGKELQKAKEFAELITGYQIDPADMEFTMRYAGLDCENEFITPALAEECVDKQVIGMPNHQREAPDGEPYETAAIDEDQGWDFNHEEF